MDSETINSTLNSSQLHDFGYSERKRYGQFNSTSDIFNIKEKSERGHEGGMNTDAASTIRTRRYQNHHYQPTCPFGRDDITVDNPHKVQNIYQDQSVTNEIRSNEGMMPQTEPNYNYPTEMAATEGTAFPSQNMPRSREGRRRGITPTSAASNGIERQEDIFVSREELQTPEQRKETLMKREKLDQLLNGDRQQAPLTEMITPSVNENPKINYATPYATSFDMKASSDSKPLNSAASVSSLAPFATIDYNPYENYFNAHRSMSSAQQLQAQAQAYNQQLPHNHDLPMSSDPHYHDHLYSIPQENCQNHDVNHYDSTQAQAQVHTEHSQDQMSPSLQTPYFHKTSSRPMPKGEDVHNLPPQKNMESVSFNDKGKGIEKNEIPPELLQQMACSSNYDKPSMNENPDFENHESLSKDHITSSFDKATALSDSNYLNKIMNDPHHHQHPTTQIDEEAITREKYEQAKNRFDELYNDIINTEDLKNHPELIEELNKISPDDLQRFQSPPPPPSHMNIENNAGKEDYMNSLEDLDKKLEKIDFNDHQQTKTLSTTMPNNNISPQEVNPSCSSRDHHHPHMNRRNYNESHIFDSIDDDPKTNASHPPPSISQSEDNMSATAKARVKASNSYNNIFGTPEYHAEVAKQEQEKRRLYSRRHWKLAQQNRSDIFCLGGDTAAVAEEQKIIKNELGETSLPPEVPTTIDRRATQMNLQASRDNPMNTTYSTMCHSFSTEDRQHIKEQPTFGISSKQSHRTYKSKSRKFTPTGSSQILF
ncbi:hypothetical protein BCR36DRAFT_325059 [Piromyces finnis]|uniref:Uncharacterized protein n=1 Tax=Piromyces finnis TaxID=1754191 RepID=A0A1Y1VC36_9FUNG|nr:hypothetical protein BCR36DRAFT_325059 [Piromyces finnis]|eukprot:ORX52220.1 hypothetical protein BCR36DRAFT_325059 [Piromyces finnis]